jgi:Domain of unknown function (DUF4249)
LTRKAVCILLFFATLQWHCIQSYVSPYKTPTTGYLVVEGYITGNGPTTFKLSRTIPLPGDSTIPLVTGAQLHIEGSDNSIYPFSEVGNGIYLLPSITMNTATRYRLQISNVNNEAYLSDFVPFKPTPPIDSVNWIDNAAGVNIYVNTHDPTGNTRYYQWTYNETWEYVSGAQSGLIYQGDSIAYRPESEQIYVCYHNDSSRAIFINTTDKLAQDVVYLQPLIFYPVNTQPLGIEYSVLVSQYALTDSAYNYLSLLQSNTEQLGSIFDPLPAQPGGNLHCLTNPGETVLGFISAGTLQQQRIFISQLQLPNWFYIYECPYKDIGVQLNPAALKFYFDGGGFTPIYLNNGGVDANFTNCVDCRAQGGTTTKPPFMP